MTPKLLGLNALFPSQARARYKQAAHTSAARRVRATSSVVSFVPLCLSASTLARASWPLLLPLRGQSQRSPKRFRLGAGAVRVPALTFLGCLQREPIGFGRAVRRLARRAQLRACAACSSPVWPRHRRRAAAPRSRAAPPTTPPHAARWATCMRRVCSHGRTQRRLPAGRQPRQESPRRCAPSTAQPAMAQGDSRHCACGLPTVPRTRRRSTAARDELGAARGCSQPAAGGETRLRWPPLQRALTVCSRDPTFAPPPAAAAVRFVPVASRDPFLRRWVTRPRCNCCARPALRPCCTSRTPAVLTRRPPNAQRFEWEFPQRERPCGAGAPGSAHRALARRQLPVRPAAGTSVGAHAAECGR